MLGAGGNLAADELFVGLFFFLFEIQLINFCVAGASYDAFNTVFAVSFRGVSLRVTNAASVCGVKSETVLLTLVNVNFPFWITVGFKRFKRMVLNGRFMRVINYAVDSVESAG